MKNEESGAAIAPRKRVPSARPIGKGRAPTRSRKGAGRAVGAPVGRRRTGGSRGRRSDPALRGQIDSAATTALVLGLIAMLVVPLIGPFAIMKGNEAGRLARRARLPVPGTATAGLVLGWIATVSMLLGLILLVALAALVVAA